MSRIECERCGGRLRLSIPDAAYVCVRDPSNHFWPRGEAEQRWIAMWRGRAEADPSDVEAALGLASVHGTIGSMSLAAGEAERALALFKDELAILEALHKAHGGDGRVQEALLESLGVQAEIAEQSGQWSTCLTVLEQMLPLAQALHDARPRDDERARALSSCLNGIGRMHRQAGDLGNAAAYFARDLELISSLCARHSDDAELATELAIAHFNGYLVSREAKDELEHLQAAERILDELAGNGTLAERGADVRDRVKAVLGVMPAVAARSPEPQRAAHASVEQADSEQGRRAWLIGRVEKELQRRRA